MNKKQKNSHAYVMAYDAIKARTTLFREIAAEHDCSVGKFLTDVIYSLLDSVYIPVHTDDKIFDKEIKLDLTKNLQAMLKEPKDKAGRFQIRVDLIDYFNEIKNHTRKAVGFPGLDDDEFNALCEVALVIQYYENGELYARLVNNKVVSEFVGTNN